MSALEHAGWWAFIGILIVVAIALNACGREDHPNRVDAINTMRHACAEHRSVFDWTDRTIDSFTGIIEWTCSDGTVGSQEYAS